jgi:hypothetical protein
MKPQHFITQPIKMKKVLLLLLVLALLSCADIKQREQDRFNEIQKSNNEIRIQDSLKQVNKQWIKDSIKQLLLKNYPFDGVLLSNVVFENEWLCCSSPSKTKSMIKYSKIRGSRSNWRIKNKGDYFQAISLQNNRVQEFYDRKKAENYIATRIWENQMEANTAQVLFNKGKYKISPKNFYEFKEWLSKEGFIYMIDD